MKNIIKKILREEYGSVRRIIRDIQKIKLDGTFYHGSCISIEDGLFSELSDINSEWGAVWVTEDEYIANMFSKNWCNDDNRIKVVFEVKVKLNSVGVIYDYTAKDLLEFFGEYDLRELIPKLKELGFNGWKTSGSIGRHLYDDYAIFNLSKVKIKRVKIYIDDNWSDFMELNKAKEVIKNLRYE